jgi:hypothetical protein
MLLGRKVNRRPPKKVVIILNQGSETEPNYFKNFKSEKERESSIAVIKVVSGKGKDPISLVNDAKYMKHVEYKNVPIERLYCVYDVDNTSEKELKSSEKEANENGILTCVSNPCFELWFLLHFRYTTANFSSYDALKDHLLGCIPGYKKEKDAYDILKPKQQVAISHARQLRKYHSEAGNDSSVRGCNPSTQVYELVEYLNKVFA